MNRFTLIAVLVLSAIIICTSCDTEDLDSQFKIAGLTLENFPIIDGSTSTAPLVMLIACKLLGYEYEWRQALHMDGSWYLSTNMPNEFLEKHLQSSQTHNSFINLIDKEVDVILSARKMSADEKAYALEAGVNLIETPIALDALIFVTHPDNRVKSLTHKQLQDIYSGKIKNWKDVGGSNAPITPYVRNKNSGSQEIFETLVLPVEQISEDFPEDQTITGMMLLLSLVQHDVNGLGYTVYYYKENIIRNLVAINTLAANGIHPNKKTIGNRKYPYVSEVYVIIRSDLEKSSSAYKIRDLLLTSAGKKVITESGYVPN